MRTLALAVLLFTAVPALAAPPAPPTADEIAKLKPQKGGGKVTVGDNIATINLPASYMYFDKQDARFVVERVWGNPPDPTVLGLIVPAELDENTSDWGVVVTYDDMGHVNDDDAGKLNYDDLLKQMQEDAASANDERKKAGYSEVQLLGWAEPPHYDAAAKKLYWAKKLQFADSKDTTLNYDVRVLGRSGALVMSAIATVDQLPTVSKAAKDILAVTEFSQGKRYADFAPSIDKVAAVGIGGLIAGKVLLKVGFFAAIVKFLGAAIKPLIALGAAAMAAVGRLFGKKKDGGGDRQV